MSDAARGRREVWSKETRAEVAALGAIADDTRAAVQRLKAEEAQLHKKLLNREITDDEHFAQWTALWKRTPREVRLARLKITKTITDACIAS
jgi:hypothetical protein